MARCLNDGGVPFEDWRAPLVTKVHIAILMFVAGLQDGLDDCIVNMLYIARGIDHDWRGHIATEIAQASVLAEAQEVKVDERVRLAPPSPIRHPP